MNERNLRPTRSHRGEGQLSQPRRQGQRHQGIVVRDIWAMASTASRVMQIWHHATQIQILAWHDEEAAKRSHTEI